MTDKIVAGGGGGFGFGFRGNANLVEYGKCCAMNKVGLKSRDLSLSLSVYLRTSKELHGMRMQFGS